MSKKIVPAVVLTKEEREAIERERRVKMGKVLQWLKHPNAVLPKDSIFGVAFRLDGRPVVREDFVDDFNQEHWAEDAVDRSTGRNKRRLAYMELRRLMEQSEARGCKW